MECEYHELAYMQASLELVDVKEEIENILKEKHLLDQRLEKKIREQNELTERCVRHIRVLKRKGMTGEYYCPKKRGIMATPTKGGSSYAPNYFPSPRSYDSKYVPPPPSGTPPQAQMVICLLREGFGRQFVLDKWHRVYLGVVHPGLRLFNQWVDS